MAAVDSAIVVQFVDDYVAEVLETFRPLGVVRKNAGVQHVGIGKDDVGALADGAAGVLGSVAVVGEGADIGAHGVYGGLELVELVFREGFGGEQVHRAGVGIGKDAVQDGQVVAEGFAAGGGSDDDDVLAGGGGFERIGLMRVEPFDAALGKRGAQDRLHGIRQVAVFAFAGGQAADGANRGIGGGHPLFEARERSFDAGAGS